MTTPMVLIFLGPNAYPTTIGRCCCCEIRGFILLAVNGEEYDESSSLSTWAGLPVCFSFCGEFGRESIGKSHSSIIGLSSPSSLIVIAVDFSTLSMFLSDSNFGRWTYDRSDRGASPLLDTPKQHAALSKNVVDRLSFSFWSCPQRFLPPIEDKQHNPLSSRESSMERIN